MLVSSHILQLSVEILHLPLMVPLLCTVNTSTLEGRNITFMCDEGYSPSGEMTTTCTANGQWEPGPQNTECVVMDGKGNGYNYCNMSVL